MSRLARDKIEPCVKEMERRGDILPDILKLCFDNGVNTHSSSTDLEVWVVQNEEIETLR